MKAYPLAADHRTIVSLSLRQVSSISVKYYNNIVFINENRQQCSSILSFFNYPSFDCFTVKNNAKT